MLTSVTLGFFFSQTHFGDFMPDYRINTFFLNVCINKSEKSLTLPSLQLLKVAALSHPLRKLTF